MNARLKHFAIGMGATVVAGITAVGVFGASQNIGAAVGPFFAQAGQGGQGPGLGPGRGRFGDPGRPGPGGPGPGGPVDLPLGRLNLSDAQKDQVKSVMDAHQEEMKTLGERARAAHEALEAAVKADTVDEATIRAKSSEVAATDADMAVMRARIRAEVLQLLTDEQKAQAKQLAQQMRAGRAGGPGRSGRGPRP
jgi:Spy/CpxP family protein refolding chaperone